MNLQFGSESLVLNLQQTRGIWGLNSALLSFPKIRSAPVSLMWHDHHGQHIWLAESDPARISESQSSRKGIGPHHLITMDWDVDSGKLHKRLEFALSDHLPILIWRFHVTNHSNSAIHLDWITKLHTGTIGSIRHKTIEPYKVFKQEQDEGLLDVVFEGEHPELAFYSNGWQSWNYAGTLDIGDSSPWSRFGPIDHPMRINTDTPRPKIKGHFISDFFAVFGDRTTRLGFILGFLSQRQTFGTIESYVHPLHPTLRMWANMDGVCVEPDQTFTTDWAYLELIDLDFTNPFDNYFEAVASECDVMVQHVSPVGWCSWYHAYESVTEEWMMENIQWASDNRERVPMDIIQLDDGYETEVGDWYSWKESFPNGIEPICMGIRESDFKPGIWIAPFIAKRRSQVAHTHPEWILRKRNKLPINPGFLWDSFPYVLDITHPEVLEYIGNLVADFVHEMGFEYLKLDFLYAGALPGMRYDRSLTRAQGLYRALQMIRDAVGEQTQLLGCGCPVGSGIGIFDAMRIGPDVAPHWKPYYRGIESLLEAEQGFPSTRNAILTTVNRLPMHQRWWVNDPDCLILRTSDSNLSRAEALTLANVIAMSGGTLMLSDHLPSLDEERVDWLARMIPPLPQAAKAVDWFDTSHPSKLMMDLSGETGAWRLILLINWKDQSTDLVLSLKDFKLEHPSGYHLIDFWNESYQVLNSVETCFKDIPPHGSCMLSLRPVGSGPQWLGDTMHTSQGLMVKNWKIGSKQLSAQLETGRKTSGKAWIALHQPPTSFKMEEERIPWEEIAPSIYQIKLDFDRNALLQVSW
jgi:alpha-galactosidase